MNRTRNPDRRKVRQVLAPVLPPRWKTESTGCRKRAYPTFEAALHVVMLRRSPYPLRIYQCPDCDRWHLTKRKHWTPKPNTATEETGAEVDFTRTEDAA